jgi:hypothetical protein
MKSLITHTYDRTLDNNLETLHHQSQEWINEITSWEDEIDLLYMISMKVKMEHITTSIKEQVQKTEHKLVHKIVRNELGNLQGAVMNHEYKLCKIIRREYCDDQNYRKDHMKLKQWFEQYEKELEIIEQEVVALLKITKDEDSLNEIFKAICSRR